MESGDWECRDGLTRETRRTKRKGGGTLLYGQDPWKLAIIATYKHASPITSNRAYNLIVQG